MRLCEYLSDTTFGKTLCYALVHSQCISKLSSNKRKRKKKSVCFREIAPLSSLWYLVWLQPDEND